MATDCDALVIGAGAAGTAAAILLAQAGWRIVLVEQHAYPRRKVCGECIAAGNLGLFDRLGIGTEFRVAAGPPLRRVGWMDAEHVVRADMPPCVDGPYAYGRALGRDRLDALLLERARSLGVSVLQPARARAISGRPGNFACQIDSSSTTSTLRTALLIDAHGSWERGPSRVGGRAREVRRPPRPADLFAFKANFRGSALAPGFLPVLALRGAYGGMVVGDGDRLTLACCLRRDALTEARQRMPGASAGEAVEEFLRGSCRGVRDALQGATREGAWLSVGPLRPGIRVETFDGVFRVGNAAGESHPLIGEGISMALQSAALLAATLTTRSTDAASAAVDAAALNRHYAAAWRRAFAPRLRMAAIFAHIAMRPALTVPARVLLERWPALLSRGARLSGKAAHSADPSCLRTENA